MQLADKYPGTLVQIEGILGLAGKLTRYLDNPLPKNQASFFDQELDKGRQFFPSFAAAVGSSQLHTLSPEERRLLKLKLLDDVKLQMARSSEEVNGSKVLEAAPLPDDPEECMRRLNEMVMEGHQKIKEITRTLSLIEPARVVVMRLMEHKRVLGGFDETLYTSMPAEFSTNKKPKKK
jgi:hypothetical protein